MYYFPYLLLSKNDTRNNNIAESLEEELGVMLSLKKSFYQSLPQELIKPLYDLLEIMTHNEKILINLFRTNLNIISEELPQIDIFRIRDRLMKLLIIMRIKSKDLLHNLDDIFTFSDIVRKQELWEGFPLFKKEIVDIETVVEWNNLLLQRLSNIHENIYKLFFILEPILLTIIFSVSLSQNSLQNDKIFNETGIIHKIPEMVSAITIIYTETLIYTKLLNSL